MAAQVTCSLLKIFRVAGYKRINLEVNLINLSTLLIRDTCVSISRFSTINRIYPTILTVYGNPSPLGVSFTRLSDTENICTISSILCVTL